VQNEVELLIMVTPNFAAPMDCHEVPNGGPGFNSDSPLDKELYMKGYIEVPATCGPEACQPNEQSIQNTQNATPALYGSAFGPQEVASRKGSVPAQPVHNARNLSPATRR
jgi:pilus assembly protein CpaC